MTTNELATIQGAYGIFRIYKVPGTTIHGVEFKGDDGAPTTTVARYSGQHAYSECLQEIAADIRMTETVEVV